MIDKLKDRFHEIIFKKQQKLKSEISILEEKLHDTESYYGCGGPYSRQEAAIEKRNKQLADLEDFDKQIIDSVKLKKSKVYQFQCGHCGGFTVTTHRPEDGWHDCPICGHACYVEAVKSKELVYVEGEVKL